MLSKETSILPKDIRKKVTFVVFVPDQSAKDSAWIIDKKTISFDDKSGVLTINVRKNNKTLTLTQQSSPEVFKDVPQQYARLLNSLLQYGEISTKIGAVALTRPKELNGTQSAVTNQRDTLLFAKPSTDLSEDEWKDFFNSLIVL
jgi:hypothetical protein